jgi:MFS transporter, OFA family, oxalate/formate antiporter
VTNQLQSFSKLQQFRIVLGVFLGLATSFATLFFSTIGVFLKPISQEFEWGRAQTSGATVMSNLGIAIGALIIGRLIDRYGAAKMVAFSGGSLVFLLACMSLVPNDPNVLAALSLLLGICSVGTTPLGYLTVLPKYFGQRLGLAFGFCMLGIGVGSVVMPVVAQAFIAAQGWRNAYVSIAGVGLVGTALAWALIFYRHKEANSENKAVSEPLVSHEGLEFSEAIRTFKFWLVFTVVFMVSASVLGFGVHGFAILTDRGVSAEDASKVIGIGASGVMLGRFLSGALMDRFQVRYIGAISFLIGSAGLAMYAVGSENSVTYLIIGAFLNSFAIGSEGDFMPYVVVRYFGQKNLGSIYGFLFSGFAVGGVVGAIIYGAIFDRTGSYADVLALAIAACAISGLLTLLLGKYRYPPQAN